MTGHIHREADAPAPHPPATGIHRHEHEHAGEAHRHPHHHAQRRGPAHEHRHTTGFERLTYIVSPVHELDPRLKIVAALILIVAVVTTSPLRPAEFASLAVGLGAIAVLGRLPLGVVLKRASVVLPIAATIALTAPLARAGGSLTLGTLPGAYDHGGWMAAWAILSKAWLSSLVAVILSATTTTPRLIRGLEALRVPDVFITLFSFLSRYIGVLMAQLRAMRTALDSRAPSLAGVRRWRVYGNLAGNLLVRSYDRGERVHAAMLSRGFSGALPTAETLRFRATDALALLVAVLAAAAVALY